MECDWFIDSTLVHIQLTHEAAQFVVLKISRQDLGAEAFSIVHRERILLLVVPRNDVVRRCVLQNAPKMAQELRERLCILVR